MITCLIRRNFNHSISIDQIGFDAEFSFVLLEYFLQIIDMEADSHNSDCLSSLICNLTVNKNHYFIMGCFIVVNIQCVIRRIF
ncbi:hypothetical protein CE91St38_09940 [Desulfovibrionaceae bacterium]|nr:hypothetical protein CE91St38_09940 [Desulfovibrionaceae bacterium]GKI11538.1 hypothetical protein CE91St39_09920 [Desulfovibrionaceae bacterium]